MQYRKGPTHTRSSLLPSLLETDTRQKAKQQTTRNEKEKEKKPADKKGNDGRLN